MPGMVCIICNSPSNNFVGNRCRRCVSAYSLEYYHKNKYKRDIKDMVHKTKEERDEHRRKYEREHLRKKLAKQGKTVKPRRKKIDITADQLKKEDAERSRKYKQRHPEKRRLSAKEWARKNVAKNVKYQREKYKSDPEFNIKTKIRSRVKSLLNKGSNGTLKTDITMNYLGCTYSFFKEYIESKFTEGMSWSNVLDGSVHLDHIRPCAKFKLTDPEEQKKCFNFSNMQPLWAIDNLRKHDKYDDQENK